MSSSKAQKGGRSSLSPSKEPLLNQYNQLQPVTYRYGSSKSSEPSTDGDLPEVYISTDKTAKAIQQCENLILNPYSYFLKAIGWLPYDRVGRKCQAVLVCIWTLCIMTTMVTQILTCFKRDAFALGEIPGNGSDSKKIKCENDLISSFIFLNIIVLATYFFGLYLFTRGESEYLFGLASHVFIKNSEAESSSFRFLVTTVILFICGIVWIFFSLAIRIMTAVAAELFAGNVYVNWGQVLIGDGGKIFLLLFSLFGFFTFDLVYFFSIMNYVIQGEMNIYLIWDVRRLIELKKHDNIDGAIKDIKKSKEYLDVWNGKTATLAALALFVLADLGITAIIDLRNISAKIGEGHRDLARVSAFLNIICWLLPFSLPFIQAARVTYWCEKLKDMATEIKGRVLAPYAHTGSLDLDSLLAYLQNIRMRASIFGLPIYPWLMYLVVVTFFSVMLILFQVDYFTIVKYI